MYYKNEKPPCKSKVAKPVTSFKPVVSNSNANEQYPHFRKYHKSKHPALITAEYSESEYNFRKVMHCEKDGRHLNEEVMPNPDARDPKPMYIGKRTKHDKKVNFSSWKYPWKYSGKDNKKK